MGENLYRKNLREKGLVNYVFAVAKVRGFFYKTATNRGEPNETGFLYTKFTYSSEKPFEGATSKNSPVSVNFDRSSKGKKAICCYEVAMDTLNLIWLATILEILPSGFPVLSHNKIGPRGILKLKPIHDIIDATEDVPPERSTILFYKGTKK